MTTTVERRESPRSKRSLIVDTAIDHFGKVGFEHTKWATIADQVGIGQTALYHYFESKAHCLLTIMSMELERSLVQFREATAEADGHVEKLSAAVASAYDVTAREALAARILVSHMDLLSTKRQSEREEAERQRARRLVREIEDEWSALVRDGVSAGSFKADDERLLGLTLLGLVISVWRWYRPRGERSLPEITEFITGACLRVVGATP